MHESTNAETLSEQKMSTKQPRLSKSKFVAGTQCHLRLWWAVHEPDADELQPDAFLLALFARGTRVGERACQEFPGGVLVDFDPRRKREAVELTRQAMESGAPAIFEACFEEDGVFVAVDILERTQAGWNLIEVKSAGQVKPEYLPDVTVQAHVLRAAGMQIERVELMHVNKENRFPSTSDLFTRVDLTDDVANWAPYTPAEIDAQLRCLAGPQPEVRPGEHCSKPYECPFLSRCHAAGPEHPVKDLHNPSKRLKEQLSSRGIEKVVDIPDDIVLKPKHQRHVDAVRSGELIVAPGLAEVLAAWEEPVAYLDFESMAPFPPCWDGCGPSTAVPIQWSVHRRSLDGALEHEAWLSEGSAVGAASRKGTFAARSIGTPRWGFPAPFARSEPRRGERRANGASRRPDGQLSFLPSCGLHAPSRRVAGSSCPRS